MRFTLRHLTIALMFVCVLTIAASAQVKRKTANAETKKNTTRTPIERKGNPPPQPSADEKPKAETPDDQQEVETVKVNTNLVTVPIIASTREGAYVPDMRQEEFSIYEDGVKQNLSFFATTTEPFHVILMLDTSASTQEKLREIQRAAIAFLSQLQPVDRVKVISFDDEIQDLNDFTNDQTLLRVAIKKTRAGRGTKLYDAMQLALDTFNDVKGRKAVVIFTDGVDLRSDNWHYDDNMKMLEESGVIVYPIRYETRAETEQLARQQSEEIGGQSDQLGRIVGAPRSGTTAPTFPGGGGVPPASGRPTGPETRGSNLPLPPVGVMNPRSGRNDPQPTSRTSSDGSRPPSMATARPVNDGISMMLDRMYRDADEYLKDLAEKSGGRMTRADTLAGLPAAFADIASELRTQYSLGYYPLKAERDGQFRKIQIKTTRKDVAVRARPGYRTPAWGK
jgi:VWFA-related protein